MPLAAARVLVPLLALLPAAAGGAAAASPPAPPGGAPAPPPRPNLLFIIVDDLRTQLSGAYAQRTLTPNIARLQAAGATFTRAYTRVTLCSPSRTALLTGARPDTTRLWTIGPFFRSTAPGGAGDAIVTLPQALKAAGYNVTGAGKVWHPGTSSGGAPGWGGGDVGGDDMPRSWSFPVPPGEDARKFFWECDAWTNQTGQSTASAGLGGAGCVTTPACVACLEAHNATRVVSWAASPCDDACYVDAMIADRVTRVLAAPGAAPWATFVGFKRPHLGLAAPQWAFDLYPVDEPLAAHRAPPPGMPPAGWCDNSEIRSYRDVPPFVNGTASPYPGRLVDAKHAELRRAYQAAVTFMDAQLGRVWDALEASGARNNTWVVFHGDHGYSLGEHGSWAKQTLWETVRRPPSAFRRPPPRNRSHHNTRAYRPRACRSSSRRPRAPRLRTSGATPAWARARASWSCWTSSPRCWTCWACRPTWCRPRSCRAPASRPFC